VRELGAWIESNILLQLAAAPFDKQDETLVPQAGSCVNCPKRTGFNKLLFPDVRKGFMHVARLHYSIIEIAELWAQREDRSQNI
jgi:hypothetical protein